MPADPARRAAELLEMSRERLVEAEALRVDVAELLFVARDRLARSRALTAEPDQGFLRPGTSGPTEVIEPSQDRG